MVDNPDGVGAYTETDDGLLLVETVPGAELGDERQDTRPALLDPRTEGLEMIRTPPSDGPSRRMFEASSRDGWVVWVETSATDYFSYPWVMFAYRVGSDETAREVARVKTEPGQEEFMPPWGDTSPAIGSDGRVYFAGVPAGVDEGMPVDHTNLYSVPLTGGKVKLEVEHASQPTTLGEGLWYVVDQKQTTEIRHRDLSTGDEDVALQTEHWVKNYGPHESGLIWMGSKNQSSGLEAIMRTSGDETEVLVASRRRNAEFGYLQVDSRYASFTRGASMPGRGFRYDIESGELYRLVHKEIRYNSKSPMGTIIWLEDVGEAEPAQMLAYLE